MNPAEAILRTREVIRRQHKAIATEASYLQWLRRYILAVGEMPPALSSERKLEAFLNQLATSRNVAASTQNQAFNAIAFFYRDVLGTPLENVDALRAVRPAQLRHAPTVMDTRALLQAVRDVAGYPTSLISRMLYGAGLRLTEPLNLRIKDAELDGSVLCIRGAKGGKDRVVRLPRCLSTELAQQREVARGVWMQDVRNRVPVEMPNQLAKKYPELPFVWSWAWLFPGHRSCRHPRTGQWVRYRMHEVFVQRAIKEARRRLGIMVLPHELRHAYATHCLERGTNPRAIRVAMGHKNLETTMGYLHAESLSVESPLEGLLG